MFIKGDVKILTTDTFLKLADTISGFLLFHCALTGNEHPYLF